MNTNELRCALTRDRKIRERFIDVFALDEFKRFVARNTLLHGIYVCNDEVAEKSGNHWFLIYVEKDFINFVDSFARPPSFYHLTNELYALNKKLNVINRRVQSLLSDVCGEYSIFFSYHLCRG